MEQVTEEAKVVMANKDKELKRVREEGEKRRERYR